MPSLVWIGFALRVFLKPGKSCLPADERSPSPDRLFLIAASRHRLRGRLRVDAGNSDRKSTRPEPVEIGRGLLKQSRSFHLAIGRGVRLNALKALIACMVPLSGGKFVFEHGSVREPNASMQLSTSGAMPPAAVFRLRRYRMFVKIKTQ